MKYFIKILYFSLLTFTSVQAQDTLFNNVIITVFDKYNLD